MGKFGIKLEPFNTHNISFPKFVVVYPKIATFLSILFSLSMPLARLMTLQCSLQYSLSLSCHVDFVSKDIQLLHFIWPVQYWWTLFCCSLSKFAKVPKDQSNILHQKMCKIARNFIATFPIFWYNFCHKFSAIFGFFECNSLGLTTLAEQWRGPCTEDCLWHLCLYIYRHTYEIWKKNKTDA